MDCRPCLPLSRAPDRADGVGQGSVTNLRIPEQAAHDSGMPTHSEIIPPTVPR
jgi:hypothetical protein